MFTWFAHLRVYLWRVVFGMAKTPTLEDISVLYKSDNFVIVNKRYDVMINHRDPKYEVTVNLQLRKLHPELADRNLTHDFRFVHQLDFSTSGVLCLALNKDACSRASKLFSSRSVLKEYVALVRGRVEADFMTIEKAVAQSTEPGYEHMMCIPTEDSTQHVRERPAVTNLQVISRGHYNGEPSTKVLLTPQTGRRHQLRVHCSHIGHTIVGDFTYSLRKDIKPYRMMLHALRLVIPLPNEHIDITAPDPFIPDIDPAWKPEESS